MINHPRRLQAVGGCAAVPAGALNVRGIRIGTAEIYRILGDIEEIREAMAVEQQAEEEAGVLVVLREGLGGVDSKDSLLGANQIQDFFSGGGLGCDGSVGFERRGVGTDGAADHRPA